MTASDLKRLTDTLKRLCAVFNRFYSEALLEGFTIALRDANIDTVEANAIAWMTAGQAMPTPRDLARGAEDVSHERHALRAWRLALDEVRQKRGSTGDMIADEIVKGLGGAHAIGQLPSEQVHGWLRREFTQAYSAASRDEEMRQIAAAIKDRPKQLPS